jgi:autotransporter translocation and assembly factor TamB
VEIGLGEKLRFRGWGVDTGLRGDLRLTGYWGQPALNGRIYSEDGTYAAYGQKLAIDRGIVEFLGPVGDPRLDILALRPNIDNQVGVMITGSAFAPRVRLYSNPELSDSEKLSWLVLGRAPDGLGRSDTALLQRAAVALLAGEGEAPTDTLLQTWASTNSRCARARARCARPSSPWASSCRGAGMWATSAASTLPAAPGNSSTASRSALPCAHKAGWTVRWT